MDTAASPHATAREETTDPARNCSAASLPRRFSSPSAAIAAASPPPATLFTQSATDRSADARRARKQWCTLITQRSLLGVCIVAFAIGSVARGFEMKSLRVSRCDTHSTHARQSPLAEQLTALAVDAHARESRLCNTHSMTSRGAATCRQTSPRPANSSWVRSHRCADTPSRQHHSAHTQLTRGACSRPRKLIQRLLAFCAAEAIQRFYTLITPSYLRSTQRLPSCASSVKD